MSDDEDMNMDETNQSYGGGDDDDDEGTHGSGSRQK
jgi:hypothetical protein